MGIPTPTPRRASCPGTRIPFDSVLSDFERLGVTFSAYEKPEKEQPPPARGQGNKATPNCKSEPRRKRVAQSGVLSLFSRLVSAPGSAGRTRRRCSLRVAAPGPGTPRGSRIARARRERWPCGLGPSPGAGLRRCPAPRALFSPPPPHALFYRPRSRKGAGSSGKESAVLWKGAEGGGGKEKENRNMAVSCRDGGAERSS